MRTADVRPGPELDLPPAEPAQSPAPAGVELEGATCWIPPGGWGFGTAHIHSSTDETVKIELQVIGSALRGVAEEMGGCSSARRYSPNIKERRDCSTAIFDAAGG